MVLRYRKMHRSRAKKDYATTIEVKRDSLIHLLMYPRMKRKCDILITLSNAKEVFGM